MCKDNKHNFKNIVILIVSMRIKHLNPVIFSMIIALIIQNDLEMITFMHSIHAPLLKLFIKNSGFKFIHYAAEIGQIEIVRYLLEIGEKIDVTTQNGFSILKIAFLKNHTELTAELIRKGALTDLPECIQLAIAANNLPIIEALIATYSDLNEFRLVNGENLVKFLINMENSTILSLLIESGRVKLPSSIK